MTGYETVISALEEQGRLVSTWGEGRSAHCPGPLHHRDDERPSLSVGEGDDGSALIYCFAGCTWREVCEGLGIKPSELFGDTEDRVDVATYTYCDPLGTPIIRVHRTEPKGFWQEHREGEGWERGVPQETPRYPYRLHVWKDAPLVYITEGEKDALTIESLGVAGTTFIGGAGKWRDEYAQWFVSRRVVVVADNDDAGYRGSERLVEALLGAGVSEVSLRYPAHGKDITDHINEGGTLETLLLVPPISLDELGPLDWQTYEVADTQWLLEPWVPRAGRVLAFGAAGSLKSLWATWLAAKLSVEGHKVAYFSLEMLASDMVRRLNQAKPDPDNFRLFTQWSFGNEKQRRAITSALKGYSLIVVDSWTAAQQFTDNDKVAQLDNDVFLPIIEATGATLLILDNVGHPSFTDAGVMKPQWARGASAKGDKMEMTLMFERPYEDNNYCTRISVKKMRLDHPWPIDVTVSTPRDRIEFYYTDADGHMSDRPMWSKEEVVVYEEKPFSAENSGELTLAEKLALARIKDALGGVDVANDVAGGVADTSGDDQGGAPSVPIGDEVTIPSGQTSVAHAGGES